MKLVKKLNSLMLKGKCKAICFMAEEKGDTNFISILVILGIVLALAGVFLVFKNQVLDWVDTNIGDFFSQSAGR